MKSMQPRHTALLVGAVALFGASAALADTPSVDATMPTMMAVTDDSQLTEAMNTNDLREQALNNVDEVARDNLEEAQQGQQEAESAVQDAAEATQDGMHGGSDGGGGSGGVTGGVNNGDGG